MKRWRVDFTVRELDVPADDARGVSFGDDVTTDDVWDFFNRCRDACVTLIKGQRPRDDKPVWPAGKQTQAAPGAPQKREKAFDAGEVLRVMREMSEGVRLNRR